MVHPAQMLNDNPWYHCDLFDYLIHTIFGPENPIVMNFVNSCNSWRRNHLGTLKVDGQSTGSSKATAIPVLGQDIMIQY